MPLNIQGRNLLSYRCRRRQCHQPRPHLRRYRFRPARTPSPIKDEPAPSAVRWHVANKITIETTVAIRCIDRSLPAAVAMSADRMAYVGEYSDSHLWGQRI